MKNLVSLDTFNKSHQNFSKSCLQSFLSETIIFLCSQVETAKHEMCRWHARSETLTHTHTHAYTHTDTHTHTHTCTHTHTHTHTHTRLTNVHVCRRHGHSRLQDCARPCFLQRGLQVCGVHTKAPVYQSQWTADQSDKSITASSLLNCPVS